MAPRDARVFSAQAFAFAQANQDSVGALLSRTRADGGGNSFYEIAPGGPSIRGWMQVAGSVIDPPSGDGSQFRATSAGLEGGADGALGDDARLGAAIGYQVANLSDSLGGHANDRMLRVSLYGSKTFGTIGVSGALSYAHGWEQTARASGIGPSFSSRGSDQFTGAIQVSAPFQSGGVTITPAAGVLFSRLTSGAFVETNAVISAFAVSGGAARLTTTSPFVVVGLSRQFTAGGGVELTPNLELCYRYDASAGGMAQTLVAADGTVFFGNQVRLDRNSALLEVSLTAHQGQWTGFAKYRANVAGNWNNQSFQVGLRAAF